MSAQPDFEDAARAIESSAIVRLLGRGARTITAAARTSRFVAKGANVVNQTASLPLQERVRLAGVVLVTFAAIHVGLVMVIPMRSAPAMPVAVWVLVALVGAGMTAGAPAVAVAWERRQLFRDQTKKL